MPMMADIKWLTSDRGLDWIVSSLRVVLAEPQDRGLPRQRASVECSGAIRYFDTLVSALESCDDNSTVLLYPGKYLAPTLITKSVSIVARGPCRDTVVYISAGETLKIDASDVDIDGITFQAALEETATQSKENEHRYELFLAPAPRTRVFRGDTMLAVTRHRNAGHILFTNCAFDAKNRFKLIVATDTQIEVRNSTLQNSEGGIASRNGGNVRIVACKLKAVNAEVVNHATLEIVDSDLNASSLSANDRGSIVLAGSTCLNCSLRASAESKLSVSGGKFVRLENEQSTGVTVVYATQYSRIDVEDSELEGGRHVLYAYGGSLLSARRTTVKNATGSGIFYSEGCSGDVVDCRVSDCEGNGIHVQKGANPKIRRCTVEGNGGLGIASSMGANLTIIECHVNANGLGGIDAEAGVVRIEKTRVFLNDGPGIGIGGGDVEIVDCEVGQNAKGQLLIGGSEWYPPERLLHRIQDRLSKKRRVRVIRTTLY
jgi:parallel beta-helix repeat protein